MIQYLYDLVDKIKYNLLPEHQVASCATGEATAEATGNIHNKTHANTVVYTANNRITSLEDAVKTDTKHPTWTTNKKFWASIKSTFEILRSIIVISWCWYFSFFKLFISVVIVESSSTISFLSPILHITIFRPGKISCLQLSRSYSFSSN